MTVITFDTHSFVKKLQAVGFTEPQAEVLAFEQANLIENRLVTKQDLTSTKNELKKEIKELETSLLHDMKELEYRIIIKLGAMTIIAISTVATLVKLL